MAETDPFEHLYLFQGLSPEERGRAVAAAVPASYREGEVIYRKGARGEAFFLVDRGKVELIVHQQGGLACVAGQVGAGGHFGEVALLTGRPRSLTVRALNAVRLLRYDAPVFESVLLANPDIHRALDKAMAERLRLASGGAAETWSAVSPAGGGERLPVGPPQGFGHVVGQEIHGRLSLARKVRSRILHFAGIPGPVLICGESGTGRRLAAKQIHLHSPRRADPYIELDMRQFDSWLWEGRLFGYERDAFPFSEGRQLGVLEQLNSGTVVLHHAEKLSHGLQRRLYQALTRGKFSPLQGKAEQPLRVRLLFISDCGLAALGREGIFIPELVSLFEKALFAIPPLREHKKDIPPLVDYYLEHYCQEYGKKALRISADALGLLMRYDWPGNLTELATVVQRAVMVAQHEEIISEQILLGLPRTEGNLVYNLLRLPGLRRVVESRLYPALPKAVVTVFFSLGLLTLFLGPREPDSNLGITLSWYVGWPLLMISFFFLPRFWCSICAMSAPGKLLQRLLRPERRAPAWLGESSGWLMAFSCLAVFWVEIVWNAYESTLLTGAIMLSIASGSLIFSLLFKRQVWCRFLCPLGALNAIFSMPSIVELRANRELCDNQCTDHACFLGSETSGGCPMFRHPFLVDNNKDCTLCGSCVKNCRLRSIQLNLRLAPRELWMIHTPRTADSFLVVSLGAVFFFLAGHREFLALADSFGQQETNALPPGVAGSLLFWGAVGLAWGLYALLCRLQATLTGEGGTRVLALLGYGFIPLVLGGYLAVYVRMFLKGAWRLLPNVLILAGLAPAEEEIALLTPEATATLLDLIMLGGFFASLYATARIAGRLGGGRLSWRGILLPYLLLFVLYFFFLSAL